MTIRDYRRGRRVTAFDGPKIEVGVDGKGTREIVIEIERVRLVRKRAMTILRRCDKCETESDFVILTEAARLFEVSQSELLQFVTRNNCHFTEDEFIGTQICLTSLLERMRTANTRRLKGTNSIEE